MKYSVSLLLSLFAIWFCIQGVCAKEASERLFVITGERTEHNEHGKTLIACERAQGQIAGQDAKIEADTIAFDRDTRIVQATGHVRITRRNIVTTGGKFRFKVDSDRYLVTQPGIQVTGPRVTIRGKTD